jgi:hypothetical protein
MNVLVQILSLGGAGLILLAFFSLQRGWWKSHGRLYLWANLVGASLLTIVAVYDRRAGFIVLEATWFLVTLWGLVKPPGPVSALDPESTTTP